MNERDDLAKHLRQLEEDLLRSEVRRDSIRVSALLADEFREFGASGRVYDRSSVLSELASESPADLSLTDFVCQQPAPGVALVTYRSTRADAAGTRNSMRSSLWVLRDGCWKILFHQGTRI